MKNALERAVLVECDEWVEANHLLLDSESGDVKTKKEGSDGTLTPFERIEFPPEGIAFEELERKIILSALEQANGNVSKAAKFLRLNRGKFRYRLERLGMATS